MLIKILNRLGACALADTLARYILLNVVTKKAQWISVYIKTVSLFISVDIIDFLHSYAGVYKGSTGETSFHGSSIQLDQPLPSLSEQLDVDVLTDISNKPDSMPCTEPSPKPQHLAMAIPLTAKRRRPSMSSPYPSQANKHQLQKGKQNPVHGQSSPLVTMKKIRN